MPNKEKDVICPKCGEKALCFCKEVGDPWTYLDEYTLFCPNCGHEERKTEDGGQTTQDNYFTFCPYCGISCEKHHPFVGREEFLNQQKISRPEVKKCSKCDHEGAPDFTFCPYCGISYPEVHVG